MEITPAARSLLQVQAGVGQTSTNKHSRANPPSLCFFQTTRPRAQTRANKALREYFFRKTYQPSGNLVSMQKMAVAKDSFSRSSVGRYQGVGGVNELVYILKPLTMIACLASCCCAPLSARGLTCPEKLEFCMACYQCFLQTDRR